MRMQITTLLSEIDLNATTNIWRNHNLVLFKIWLRVVKRLKKTSLFVIILDNSFKCKTNKQVETRAIALVAYDIITDKNNNKCLKIIPIIILLCSYFRDKKASTGSVTTRKIYEK